MNKLYQTVLSLRIEHHWKKAEKLRRSLYANPSLPRFRRLADRYRLAVLRANQLQTLHDAYNGIHRAW